MKIELDQLVGLFAPHLCLLCAVEGSVVCERCMVSAGEPVEPRCAGCKKLSTGYKTCKSCRSWLDVYAVYAANPHEGIYDKVVQAYKFDLQRSAADVMATMMDEVEKSLPVDCIVSPMPTAPKRIRQRGFDHTHLLAKRYAEKTNQKAVRLLGRKTNSRQVGSSRSQRMKQMEQEFYLLDSTLVTGRSVLLVDDVMTTGASIASAAKTLKAAGAKRVYAVVFAQGH